MLFYAFSACFFQVFQVFLAILIAYVHAMDGYLLSLRWTAGGSLLRQGEREPPPREGAAAEGQQAPCNTGKPLFEALTGSKSSEHPWETEENRGK